jgi:hypothetical protein
MLSKKKKREESKESTNRNLKNGEADKKKNMKIYYQGNNIDVQQQMMKNPFNMFYNQNTVDQMKISGYDNNQAMLIKMNSKLNFNF